MNQRKKTGNPETWKDWEQICADAEKLGSVNKKVELVRVRRNKVELKQTDFENNQESLITEFLLIIKFEMYDLRFEKWSDFEGVEEFEIWVMSNNKIILKFKHFGGERITCFNFLFTVYCLVV